MIGLTTPLGCDRRVRQYVYAAPGYKEVKTDCSVNATYKGKTYCFGNEAAKEQFMKDPEANLANAQKYYEQH